MTEVHGQYLSMGWVDGVIEYRGVQYIWLIDIFIRKNEHVCQNYFNALHNLAS